MKPSSFRQLPLGRIAGWGFLFNMVWEFAQCTLLYDMWSWGFRRATLWMWGAVLGDVAIVLGVAYLAFLIAGASHLRPLDRTGWMTLLATGFVASVVLEWLARVLGLWGYSELMPTLTLLGFAVGLSPVAQVTMLPALSVYLASRKPEDRT